MAFLQALVVWQSSCASKLLSLKTANIIVQPFVDVQLIIRNIAYLARKLVCVSVELFSYNLWSRMEYNRFQIVDSSQ